MALGRPLLGTLRSMTLWIAPTVALALAGLAAVRRLIPTGTLRDSSEAVGNYLQTLGTIYAVLLAFVVFVVWQQFNDTRAHVEREANELMDLTRSVKALPRELHGPLCALVDRYLTVVLGQEWQAMSSRAQAPFEDGARLLDEIWDLLVAYEPCSECHKSLYNEALARFNDLSDTRVMRISASRLRIPMALRVLLYAGAFMTVASMYLMEVPNAVVHALMTGALAGAVSHLLYIVADLDDCFAGDWTISPEPYLRVRRHLQRPPAEAASSPEG